MSLALPLSLCRSEIRVLSVCLIQLMPFAGFDRLFECVCVFFVCCERCLPLYYYRFVCAFRIESFRSDMSTSNACSRDKPLPCIHSGTNITCSHRTAYAAFEILNVNYMVKLCDLYEL